MNLDDAEDEVAPLPHLNTTSPKRLRRRAAFAEPSIAAASIIPSSVAPNQIISTLINSLSVISQSAHDQLQANLLSVAKQGVGDGFDRPRTSDSFYADIPIRRVVCVDSTSENDGDSDENVAAPPVIRMARAPPMRKKQPEKDISGLLLSTIYTDNTLSVRSSILSMRSHDSGMGVPSIERPNGSSTSLAISTSSARSRSPSSTRYRNPYANGNALRPSPSRSYSDMQASDTDLYKQDMERDRGNSNPRFSFEAGHEPVRGDHATPKADSRTINALSPLARGDLQEHLIPNRRSSLRKSSSSEDKENYRNSTGSRDLRDLNIDEDLIGSDDSTVRRIRELQEAREKRQIEWRKEARNSSDRSIKRHSAPSPKEVRRSSIYQSSKLSVTEVLTESEQESSPDMSATISGNELVAIPAFVPDDEPLTPLAPPAEFTRQPSPSSTPAPHASPARESRPSLTQAKRLSTVSSTTGDRNDHVKSVTEEVDAFLSASRLTQKIRHPRTGRTIAFSEVGDPKGFTVFCCVGMGLTRYVTAFYDELARTLKLRLITPDRPGVGESEFVSEKLNNPLTWVDDVAVICHTLEISRFSLLAHSAGAIYALATALKMPQFVRGRIHLLAPWIPPSQMPKGAAIGPYSQPVANLPMAHRILSVLPAPFLKVANSRFLSATSAYVEAKPNKSSKMRNPDHLDAGSAHSFSDLDDPSLEQFLKPSPDSTGRPRSVSCYQANNEHLTSQGVFPKSASPRLRPITTRANNLSPTPASPRMASEARAASYNRALTHKIWSLSTLNANPAIDLMTCLERKKTIGFRYAEVTRSVVIHHGAKDSRVPLDNVRWLHSIMKRCDLRILEEEGHGLMASASVMSSVLTEIAKEWDEWERIAKNKEKKKRDDGSSVMSLRSLSISVRS